MRRILTSLMVLLIGSVPMAAGTSIAQTTSSTPDRTSDRELAVYQLDASGLTVRRTLIDSLTLFGTGRFAVTDRGSTKELRNLFGFESPQASGERIGWNVDVKGSKEILTSATLTKDGPISIKPRYFLNGRRISPSALRGRSGRVAIEYRLINTTLEKRNLQHLDAQGNTVATALDTYMPLVGQVEFLMPADHWSRVTAKGGQVTTDEKNVHHATFSAVLAPIVGAVDQTIRVEGTVRDFRLEETRASFIPVVPAGVGARANSTSKSTADLFGGVGQVDANLIKLHDGTAQLTAGLQQLYAGILRARQGVGSLGTDGTIVDGLQQVLDGLKKLGGASGLPAAKAGVDSLIVGVQQLIAGLGSATTPNTVLGGLAGLDSGLARLKGTSGLTAIKGGIDVANGGVGALAGSIGTDPSTPAIVPNPADPSATSLSNDLQYIKENYCGADVTCLTSAAVAQGKLDTIKNCFTTGGAPACSGAEPNGIAEALSALSIGTQSAIDSIGDPTTSPATTLRGGLAAVTSGVGQVKLGLASGNANNPKVLEGLQAVAAGLTSAIAGIGAIGSNETLTDGVNRLFVGSQELGNGLDQLAAGAGTAADGSTQIADGTGQLSAEGTKVIQTSVGDSMRQASEAVAIIGEMQKRSAEGAMLYGAPEGATGSTTFVYKVAAITRQATTTLMKLLAAATMVIVLLIVGRLLSRTMGGGLRPMGAAA